MLPTLSTTPGASHRGRVNVILLPTSGIWRATAYVRTYLFHLLIPSQSPEFWDFGSQIFLGRRPESETQVSDSGPGPEFWDQVKSGTESRILATAVLRLLSPRSSTVPKNPGLWSRIFKGPGSPRNSEVPKPTRPFIFFMYIIV